MIPARGNPETADLVRQDLSRGEVLLAYDRARAGLKDLPGDHELRYLAVLALARAGATSRAEQDLAESGLEDVSAPISSSRHAEDVPALRARLAKDRALRVTGDARVFHARLAAGLYEDVYRRFGRPYSCINAATMWLVAGDRRRSLRLAGEAMKLSVQVTPSGAEDLYWTQATVAEASLLLGDPATARAALAEARTAAPTDSGAWATTRRQLAVVAAETGVDPALLDLLSAPAVVHFCGHMVKEGGLELDAASEAALAREIQQRFDAAGCGFAYGSLASGADILCAEAVLAAGAELHAVFPFDPDEFREVSVEVGGGNWGERFDHCLDAARTVTVATDGEYLGDDVLFAHGAQVAMGLALIRARFLGSSVLQIAAWDGEPGTGAAGTHQDVVTWTTAGHHTEIIDIAHRAKGPGSRRGARAGRPSRRRTLAMLFGDVRGFGRLGDGVMPTFVAEVLGPIGEVLHRHQHMDLSLSSAGDGFFAVFDDVAAAAACALDLQHRFASIDLEELGLPPFLGLRIGGHVGPVFELDDPITKKPNYYGLQVTRTARIEPRTPEGEVYVSAPFAALLELTARGRFSCEYVGHMPTAKEHGVLPMYLLKR
ncbi:MAG: adenylate/guanylate cyclase domain-containing protein [Candidatus Dormibacteria bacterium]